MVKRYWEIVIVRHASPVEGSDHSIHPPRLLLSLQFPTLGFVVERYWEIMAHVSEQFWSIQCQYTERAPPQGEDLKGGAIDKKGGPLASAHFSWKSVLVSGCPMAGLSLCPYPLDPNSCLPERIPWHHILWHPTPVFQA